METTQNFPKLSNAQTPYQNEEDKRVITALRKVQKAFIEACKDVSFRDLAIKSAQSSSKHELTYYDIVNLYPKFESLLASQMLVSNGRIDTTGLTQSIIDSMLYNGLQYYPVIYIPNANTISQNSPYIVALGTELEDSVDVIPGEMVENTGNTTVVVSEEAATTATFPIFIITNGTNEIDYDPNGAGKTSSMNYTDDALPNAKIEAVDRQFKWHYARIKGSAYRYEGASSNPSDMKSVASLFNTSGTAPTQTLNKFVGDQTDIYSFSSGQVNSSSGITSIAKKIFDEEAIPDNVYTDFHFVLYNTFEYDWYAGLKDMPNEPNGGQASCNTLRHGGRMKYANEWYTYTTFQCPSAFPYDLDNLSVQWSYFQVDNNKAVTEVKRYQ